MALLTPDAFEDADEMQRQLGHANEEVRLLRAALAAAPSHSKRASHGDGQLDQDAMHAATDSEVLQSRVDALSTIIALQEEALTGQTRTTSSPRDASTHPHSSLPLAGSSYGLDTGRAGLASSHSGAEDSVLRKWREKVFEMLVKERAVEARHARELRQATLALDNATSAARAQEMATAMLSAEKDAELRRLADRIDAANATIEEERTRRREAEKERDAAAGIASRLKLIIPRAEAEYARRVGECTAALARLDVLTRRVSFATERVRTCQHIMAVDRQRAIARGRDQADAGSGEEDEEESVSRVAAATSALESEIDRLRRERDFLVAKAEEDSQTFASRVEEARARCAAQLAAQLADTEAAAATARAERDASEAACIECETRLAAAQAAAEDRVRAVVADRDRVVAAKQRELDVCIAERDAARSEVERAVVDKTTAVAKITSRVVELEHELERARGAAVDEHRAERIEWERRVSELESRLNTLSADRNAVSASLEQANFRLWSRSHSAGPGSDRVAGGQHPWPRATASANPTVVLGDDEFVDRPELTWPAGRRPAPRPLRSEFCPSGLSESEADEDPRRTAPTPTNPAGSARLLSVSSSRGGGDGSDGGAGRRTLLVGDDGESSGGRTPPGGLAAAESKMGSEAASLELGLSRPVRELDTKTAVAALHALSQDLLHSSAGVM